MKGWHDQICAIGKVLSLQRGAETGCVGYFPFVAPNLPVASLHPALCSSRLTVLGLQQRVSLLPDLQMSPDHRGQEQGMGGEMELETGASVPQLPLCCGLRCAEALLPPAALILPGCPFPSSCSLSLGYT